ncbi:CHAT domain-containing protein [Suillus bovinus]|uniref:CHAT domain-containing protein n=1 Tax=Suillus bovinus TaxID=48563 RepID=UPI001B86A57E|nr:CHAT domain-containing protein [Suillus bovinus]KAG2147833.1 CHAT domain-containing protein [Suillus bovinus]
MAHRRRVSSTPSESDFSPASSLRTSPSQKQDNEEPNDPNHTQDPAEMHLSGVQPIITAIRATDLTLGLRWIPAGFHAVIKANGVEYQTSNISVNVDQAVIEWRERIPLPHEPCSKVRVSVYASFELGPMLCHGELLRTFEISVGELLDRSERSHCRYPIIFQPKQREVISACTSLFMRVEQQLSDPNEAAFLCLLTNPASPDIKALALRTDVGHRLLARYRRMQNGRDLEQSIDHFELALHLCPMNHPYRPAVLFNLATAKFVSCQAEGRYLDLDDPVSLFEGALDLRPTDHPDRTVTQLYLAVTLLSRFAKRGFQTDADAAKELLSEIVNVCHANSHIHRAAAIAMETCALHSARSINANDLEQEWHARSMLPLSPNQLTDQTQRCLERDEPRALDEVISLHYDALGYYNAGHDCRGRLLNNLALILHTRFERQGNDKDLDQAIALQTEVLALWPVGHTDRFMSLNNLATQLSSRFDHRGNGEDLDQTIALHREALALRPSLHNLATQLSSRFDHRGNGEDLDEAYRTEQGSAGFMPGGAGFVPVGHRNRSKSFNNLANQLSSRFRHRGNGEDLDQAIALQREAVALCPVGHTDRSSSLGNLANQLSSRFDHQGNGEDLDQAFALQREALALCPATAKDLDQAIALQREALTLCPVGHTDRSMSLYNLANRLSSRFGHRGNDEDLNESRENLLCALTLLTQHNPRQLMVHESIANVYLSFHHLELDGTGAGENTESLLSRLRASLTWVHYAHQYSHGTQLEAYATSMQLLDAYMSMTASVSSRHDAMKGFPRTLAVDAASCALRSGDVGRAVELLEQGRTIIWTQMTRLHTPLDRLQTCGDHAVTLMKKFADLSSLLDKPTPSHPEGTQRVDVEAEATRYRRLVDDWNSTVEEIRKIKDFSRFLLPPLFSDLQDAARDGPIIMLIASESSCDAIIIPHKQPPTSIQLSTDIQKLAKLVLTFREAVDKETGHQRALMKALHELWNDVVGPVVEKLGGLVRLGSRIWWCPTFFFNFLPLHAAREYRNGGKSLSQLYISSYTPSLTALINARASRDRPTSVPFVAIGQNCPAGASFTLDAVEPELELVRKLLPPPPTVSFSKITSVDATKSRALCALRENTWFHLACHGTQKFNEPFQSAFLMRDQPLSLLDIAQTDLSRHHFAFLSACETAVGDVSTPDEVIHLAAGLQFAGVRSVVGTLWKVDDPTVHLLVKAFYEKFCEGGTMSPKRAAQALHRAVQSLASDVDIPLAQRIVFVHIGI